MTGPIDNAHAAATDDTHERILAQTPRLIGLAEQIGEHAEAERQEGHQHGRREAGKQVDRLIPFPRRPQFGGNLHQPAPLPEVDHILYMRGRQHLRQMLLRRGEEQRPRVLRRVVDRHGHAAQVEGLQDLVCQIA